MSRYFTPLTLDEFKTKLVEKFGSLEKPDLYPTIDNIRLDKTIWDDLSKVKFDWENWDAGEEPQINYPGLLGLQTLSNGMPYLGIWAGGDWEFPVFFIVYFDGRKFRGYVPKDGNAWNHKTKQAYGNDSDADLKDFRKRFNDPDWDNYESDNADGTIDCQKIIQDIIGRIKNKNVEPDPEMIHYLQKIEALKKFSNKDLIEEVRRRKLI